MNIAFFTNYIFTPHYETELELIQLHLDKGDTVYHFVCDSHLLSCDFNPKHEWLKCQFCISKRKKGQELLSGKKNYIEIKLSENHTKDTFPSPKVEFNSIAELRNYKIDNFEIGDAAFSSLVSILRDPRPDLHLQGALLSNILLSSHYSYQYFLKELTQYNIAVFYIFNGRFAVNRAALRAAQHRKVLAYIHERGSNSKTYELFENVLPHEISPFTQRTLEAWNNYPDTKARQQIAHDFYKDRVIGKEQSWLSFITEQKAGLLPENWNPDQENIVVFNSSEDEYVSIGEEWDLGIFISQNTLILQLMNDPRLSEKKIWVRLHPNMRLMAKKYLEDTYATLNGNIEVILPDSPINSYDLIHAASKVLTFGSTIGVEATYWGKPSILIGPSFYKHFDVTYNPANYEELMALLLDKNLKAFPQENTLPYGFYSISFGIPFTIYEPANLFEGKYKGVNLDKSFNYKKWQLLTYKRGFHWLYNKLDKMSFNKHLRKYV